MTARRPRTTQARQRALDSARPGTFLDGVKLTIGTLTALRVPAPSSMQPPAPGIAMALAPATGLIPGVAAAAVATTAGVVGLSPFPAAALGIGTLALTTRGLHLDGLADTADGLASSYDRDRALDVMRRGNTGPAGMATLVLVLLVQAGAAAQALAVPAWGSRSHFTQILSAAAVFVIAAVAGRVAVALACTRGIRAARSEGLGATVSGSVAVPVLILVAVLAAAACTALAWWSGQPWQAGVAAVPVGMLASGLVIRRAVARFGGITGDVIGAAIETATTAALLVLAAYNS